MTDKKSLKISIILGALTCLPLTGFIYGFIICSDCGNGFVSVPGRMFLGIIYSFFTILTFGKPWTGGGIISSVNLRLYVFMAFIILALITYLAKYLVQSRRQL